MTRAADTPSPPAGTQRPPRRRQPPVTDAVGVEPHKTQQPVGANSSEQVCDLRRFADAGAAPVSAMSIRAMVSARTALMVGPNSEENVQDDLK